MDLRQRSVQYRCAAQDAGQDEEKRPDQRVGGSLAELAVEDEVPEERAPQEKAKEEEGTGILHHVRHSSSGGSKADHIGTDAAEDEKGENVESVQPPRKAGRCLACDAWRFGIETMLAIQAAVAPNEGETGCDGKHQQRQQQSQDHRTDERGQQQEDNAGDHIEHKRPYLLANASAAAVGAACAWRNGKGGTMRCPVGGRQVWCMVKAHVASFLFVCIRDCFTVTLLDKISLCHPLGKVKAGAAPGRAGWKIAVFGH